VEEVRSAKDDLALCDKATPGPWEYDGMHNEIQTPRGETYWLIVSECRSAPDQGYPDDYSDVPQYDANFDFIAMAREALPYWIERAERLERALEHACVKIEDLAGDCPGSLNWIGCGGTDGKCSGDQIVCWKKFFMEESE